MWIVLCAGDDPAGLWAYLGLRRRGLAPLELVTPDALAFALSWHHRVGRDGVETEIRLADGRRLHSEEIRGVVNRFCRMPEESVTAFRHQDRSYVLQELHALHLSWLSALPVPVLNRPSPFALAGRRPSAAEWRLAAAGAGLTVPGSAGPRRQRAAGGRCGRAARSLLVAGAEVLPDAGGHPSSAREEVPAWVARAVRCLARSLGLDLLEVWVAPPAEHAVSESWSFLGGENLPNLRRWRDPGLAAVMRLLTTPGVPAPEPGCRCDGDVR